MTPKRHVHIVDDLRLQITTGALEAGSQLPAESVLMKRYATSRTTLREAFARLENEGLLVRRQGIGNFVRHSAGRIAYATGSRQADGRTAANAALEISLTQQTVKASAELADRLKLPVGSDVAAYTYKSQYMRDPCSLARVYVPHAVALLDVPWPGGSPMGEEVRSALVQAEIRIAETITRVSSRLPVQEEAWELRIGTGTAVLEIERVTTDIEGRVVELARIVLPGFGADAVFTELAPARELEVA
nr:GntR family transcriptional regulator [Streptomyces sp. NBC_00886]